jgi:hypothetical protein
VYFISFSSNIQLYFFKVSKGYDDYFFNSNAHEACRAMFLKSLGME